MVCTGKLVAKGEEGDFVLDNSEIENYQLMRGMWHIFLKIFIQVNPTLQFTLASLATDITDSEFSILWRVRVRWIQQFKNKKKQKKKEMEQQPFTTPAMSAVLSVMGHIATTM
jgi:hypothetical protein